MIRQPPRSTLSSSSAASDVYKRQDKEREHQDKSLDKFEKQQKRVNKFLREMREAKMDDTNGKLSLSTFGADAENAATDRAAQQKQMKKGHDALKKFEENQGKFNEGMLELEGILQHDTERYEKDAVACQEESSLTSDISFEQTLKIREKTIELLRDQYQIVVNFGARKKGARGKKLEERAHSHAMQVDDLGQLPDLDPESWVHYREYIKKDQEIDEALLVLHEKNLVLKERAMAVADNQRKVAPIEEQLAKDVENVTAKAELAKDKMAALKDAIDGKGPGKICVYIMIVLGICGIGYLLYCEGGGDSC
eukprot:TRINITY_DN39072_c0_g1_i1.p1 TRINITY_DN39072_c0_g1~~TRINITY_DN39072_c0_g1_i1.p1  ORF type:complete len:309 (-),score=93.85 TRINITY_DN39072_c0_g1_i1:130-1056(-)